MNYIQTESPGVVYVQVTKSPRQYRGKHIILHDIFWQNFGDNVWICDTFLWLNWKCTQV